MNSFEDRTSISPLRQALHPVDWKESANIVALLALSYLVWNFTFVKAIGFTIFFVFLWPRGSQFLSLYGKQRWPHQPSKQNIPIWIGRAVSVLIAIGYIQWRLVAQHEMDWASVRSNAISIAAFGVFMLVLVGPLMLLLDRVFKPLAESQKLASVLGFLTLCGAWWMVVILGSVYSGLAHVIFGGAQR